MSSAHYVLVSSYDEYDNPNIRRKIDMPRWLKSLTHYNGWPRDAFDVRIMGEK